MRGSILHDFALYFQLLDAILPHNGVTLHACHAFGIQLLDAIPIPRIVGNLHACQAS